MKNFDMKKINQAGSLMIEAIAMLGLISLVTPVVYKKSAERMTELQDINAASHMRMLSSALDAYISDNYDTLKGELGETAEEKSSSLDADKLVKYLPEGAVEGGKVYGPLGEDYKFSYVIKKTDNPKAPVITGYVGAKVTDDKITAQRTSRIATMIGGNGAVAEGDDVLGVQGTWQTTSDKIGLGGIADDDHNSVVVASQNAVGATAQIDTSKFLYRVEDDVENNTMQTNLYMWGDNGANSIEGVSQLLIGYQAGRDGNQYGTADTGATPTNYDLYVNGIDSNTWLGGSLEAAQGKLSATETEFKYNPYETVETGGSAINNTSGLTVNNSGMTFSRTGDSKDKFAVNGNTLTYADNLISANIGAEESGDTRAVRFFGNSDDAKVSIKENETQFFGDGAADGAKVSIKEDRTLLRNRLVADYNGIYEEDIDAIDDDYRKVGDSVNTNFSRSKAMTSDFATANVLTGKTYATELETGYLKTEDFDAKNLRAGRSNLENSQETWMLDVQDGVARLGKDNPADTSARPSASALYVVDYGSSVKDISNTERDMGIYMISRNSENLNRNAMVAINPDGVNTTVKGGDIVMNVSPSDSTKGVDGTITLSRDSVEANNGITVTPKYDKGSFLQFNASNNIQLQGDQYIHIQTVHHKSGDNAYGGKVVLQNNVLAVSGSDDVSKGDDNFNVKDRANNTIRAGVYIRRGSIDVQQFEDLDKIASSTGKNAADAGTGYVKADRFVVENTKDNGHERDPNEVYKDKTIGQGVRYDHYMVDPAYTSVMHDIKLTSRGGARLSDILPDFINKGIYVTDNSYPEGTEPSADFWKPTIGEGDRNASFASAYLGGVPAPQCPPGYAKVITLTPAGWRMAQIGTLVEDSTSNGRLYLNETTPEYNGEELVKETEYSVTAKTGSNSVVRIPKIFQQNTWLKSAIKVNTSEEYSTGSTAEAFKGWNVYMGFIYPQIIWSHVWKNTGGKDGEEDKKLDKTNLIYWNLFPVDQYSIEGYATVYCYFDRGGLTNGSKSYFNETMVDTTYNQFGGDGIFREVGQGVKRSNPNYIGRLNNPKLKYTQEW